MSDLWAGRRRDAALAGAATLMTGTAWAGALRGAVPGGPARWARRNHAGDPVTLLEGAALVVGVGAAALAAGPATGLSTARVAAVLVAVTGAGLVGAVDDLHPDAARKGLAGHLGALRRGQLTTGAVKIAGLAATGAAAAVLHDRDRPGRPVGDALLGGAAVAGAANLLNLLDLRPGRALKAALLATVPLVLSPRGSPVGALTAGAAAVLLRPDLRGVSMLGDTGANPLGALVGLALLERQGRAGRAGTVAVLTGLTVLSERVSFTRVIGATPGLRELDELGRPRR